MRILLVNYEYPPQSGGGGIVMQTLAKGLVRHGHTVDLLVGWDFSLGSPCPDAGMDTFYVPIKRKSVHCSVTRTTLGFVWGGAKILKRLTRERSYDLINYFFSVPTGLIQIAAQGRVPYLCMLNGIDVPFFNKWESPVLQLLVLPFNYWILKKAAALISPSDALGRHLNRWFPSLKPRVIHNGLDLSKKPYKKEYAKRALRFVCVSRLIKLKRLDVLIDAFSKICANFPEAILDIYGDGYLYNNLRQRIEKLGLTSKVRLCGHVASEELSEKMSSYDVFVLPTEADSFGMVFIEAMAAGLPVIAANCGGPKEIVVHEQNGLFVEPGSVDELVRALRRFIEQDHLGETLGRQALKHVQENFTEEKTVQHYMDVYRTMLQRKEQ